MNTDSSQLFANLSDYNFYLSRSLKTIKSQKKSTSFLVRKRQPLQIAGCWEKIKQIIAGILGLVNKTSQEALEFQIIRVLTCGAQNAWINAKNLKVIQELAQFVILRRHKNMHPTLNFLHEIISQNPINNPIDFNRLNQIYFNCHNNKLQRRTFFSSFFSRCLCNKHKIEEKERDLINVYKAEMNRAVRNQLKKNQGPPPPKQNENVENNNPIPPVNTAPMLNSEIKPEIIQDESILVKNNNEEPPQKVIQTEIAEKSDPVTHLPQKITPTTPPIQITDDQTKINFDNYVEFLVDEKKYHLQATGISTVVKYFFTIYSLASYLQIEENCDKKKIKNFELFSDERLAKQITIKMKYHKVTQKQLADGCHDSFKKVLKNDYPSMKKTIDEFVCLYEDLKVGDEQILRWLPGGIIEVYVKGIKKGALQNRDFAQALSKIWLGENSVCNRNRLVALV